MENKEAETIVDADPMAPSPSGEEPEKSENKAIEGVETNVSSDASRPKRSKQAKPIRPFPQYTIEDAICVPKVIGAQNAGKPWPVEHVASALNTSKNTNSFFYLTSASRDYGFTTGTSRAKTIELTALGRKIVFPESQIDEAQAFSEAFNNIDLFKKVNEYYNGNVLPDKRYFFNTLGENFGIDASYHQEFLDIFEKNRKLLGQNKQLIPNAADTPKDIAASSLNGETQDVSGELFVIMPFSEKTNEYPKGYFDEVYNSLLVPAAAEAGLTAKTAKRSGSDIIHSTIVSDIFNAQIVLADLTEHNPNVLFELGLAIAFKKRVVLIRAKGTNAIFDVDNLMRVYDYDRNLWKSTIERDIPNLSKHIQATLETDGSMYLDILLKK